MSFLTGPRLLRGPADCPPALNADGRFVLPALAPVEFNKHARHDRRRPRFGIGQRYRITGGFRFRRLFRYRRVVPFAAHTRVPARSIHPDPHSPMHALLPHQLQDPQPSEGDRIPLDARGFAVTREPDSFDLSFGSAARNRELPLDIGNAATADFSEANPTELTAPASVTASGYPPVLIFTREEWSQFTAGDALRNDVPDTAPAPCAR